jgi:hypothetical protein
MMVRARPDQGSPYPRWSSPHSGGTHSDESVGPLSLRRKRRASSAPSVPHAGCHVLIPSRPRAESGGKLMSIKNARLSFARIIEHPGKANQSVH